MRRILPTVIILILTISEVEAATIYVPDNYNTIQKAVEEARADDTIIVREGSYKENIVIKKPITIRSQKGPEFTLIEAREPGKPVISIIGADNVTLSGFTVTGSSVSGIHLEKSNNGEIEKNISTHNRVGIYLYLAMNNVLTENEVTSNDQTGIYLVSSNNNTLIKNMADSNTEKGIFLNSSNRNKLMYNSASFNRWNGITLWSSNNNRLEGNEVLRNTYSIVESASLNNVLVDNYTWTNFFIILPILLVYVGVLFYLIQKRIFRLIYSG